MAILSPCPHCRCYVAPSETRCPFCARPLRTTTAWPAWLLGLSLTGLGACVVTEDPESGRETNAGVSQGNDSIDDDDWGGGVTYAGPDPWDTNGDTFNPGGDSTTGYGTTIDYDDTDSESGTTGTGGSTSSEGSGTDSTSTGSDPDTGGSTGEESP